MVGQTQSHNLLPSKIGTGILAQQPLAKPGQQAQAAPTMLTQVKTASVARLYQTTKEAGAAPSEAPTPTAGSIGASLAGRAALKVSNQKSPGKSFKSGRGTQSAAQMNTLVGAGVFKQQQLASNKM